MDKRYDARRRVRAARLAAAAALALGLAACDSVVLAPFTEDERNFREVPADDPRAPRPRTRLGLDLPTLEGASSLVTTRIAPGAGLHERRRSWRTGAPDGLSASIVLRRRLDGGEIAVPGDIREALKLWPELAVKTADYEPLHHSRNALGRVFWRRFVIGGRICVLFQQGVGPDPDAPTRRLAGYYCAAAGDGLTPGQAESVVRAVRLVDEPG